MTLEYLRGKKLAIVGLGVNNQALAEYLKKNGLPFDVVGPWQSADELIGKLDHYDLIFRTPGLPYLCHAIQQAKTRGVEISSQSKLFFEFCPAPIIGVSGTKGKGTTSSLIAKILSDAGRTVWLGGNIGKDPFEFLDQISKDDLVVLELSSFQIQDLTRDPHIAVLLNITPDHLNHHQSMEEYVNSKTNMIAHQSANDIAILHPNLPEDIKKLGAGRKIFFDPTSVADYKTKLLGRHNWENIAAAAAVTELLGVPEKQIQASVADFEPLPHRLKNLGIFGGITYIDDGFSTNVEPTIAAMKAFDSPLIVITGGFNKGLDFTTIGQAIKEQQNIKAVVAVGQMTDQILTALNGFAGKVLTGAKDISEILSQARSLAEPGDTILFSPGTSSFDMFKNEYDRAEQFVNEVVKLQ